MPIVKRKSLPTVAESEPAPKANWFENLEVKEKKPLPDRYVLAPGMDAATVRKGGFLFAATGELTVADQLQAIRTPQNPNEFAETRYRARITNRGTAMTSFCVNCQGGSRKQVAECYSVDCPIWAFRFGTDPLRGKR